MKQEQNKIIDYSHDWVTIKIIGQPEYIEISLYNDLNQDPNGWINEICEISTLSVQDLQKIYKIDYIQKDEFEHQQKKLEQIRNNFDRFIQRYEEIMGGEEEKW